MKELIQWDKAKYWEKPWNPMVGCVPCSPACEHCYAKASMEERFGMPFEPHATTKKSPPTKGIVFCGNMTDLWGEWNHIHGSVGYYHRACDYIAMTLGRSQKNANKGSATYLWLTKRVRNMVDTLNEGGWEFNKDYWSADADVCEFKDCDMSNHYFGFTAENQKMVDERFCEAREFPKWANMWVSCEPLLERVVLPIDSPLGDKNQYGLKWVVVGCESGKNRRPCRMEWIEEVVEQCTSANIPVFVKQICMSNGEFTNKIEQFPSHLRIRQTPWG